MVGFGIFGLAFVYTIIMIALDIKKSGDDYEQLIANDLAQMASLGLDRKMGEIQAALEERLAGHKQDDGLDDKLMGEAVKLTEAQYKKYA